MRLTRRDMIKMGALGSAALVLPLERTARGVLQQANRLDPSLLPAVGQLPVQRPEGRQADADDADRAGHLDRPRASGGPRPGRHVEVDYYEFHMRQPKVPILPGLPETLIWGYRGTTPGPTIHAERGRPVLVRHYNDITRQHPVLRYGPPETSVHLHGNPSLPQHDGYASDTTAAGAVQGLLVPGDRGRPHALVPRPRRPPHGVERLHGARRPVPAPRRRGARLGAAAAGEPGRSVRQPLRRAARSCATRCSTPARSSSSPTTTSRARTAT